MARVVNVMEEVPMFLNWRIQPHIRTSVNEGWTKQVTLWRING